MELEQTTQKKPLVLSYGREPRRRPSAFANWFWFILKNLVGWLFILISGPIGFTLPGPGGLPLFLFGFALITFPGKRQFTARVLHGKPIRRDGATFRRGVAGVALLLPAAVTGYLWGINLPHGVRRHGTILAAGYLISATLLFVLGLRSDLLLNRSLSFVPRLRRRVRPWLRRRGIDLLPPRRRRRRLSPGGDMTRAPDEEILEISAWFGERARSFWAGAKPWLRRFAGIAIAVAIFLWILKPVVKNWALVHERLLATSWSRFFVAAGLFAVFLFLFRAMSWRRILSSFGFRLPVAAATRIWSTSELARYLPGVIWQVAGRVYLVRPYGVRGSICSTSQILELAIFLLANLLVAVGCLVWGIRRMHADAGLWLYAAMALVPILLTVLHPRILYAVINTVLKRFGKPPVAERMGFAQLSGLLGWAVLGVLWQSVAIFLVTAGPLHLPLAKWWIVAGAYALAWCAGFLAVLAPGGLGVREGVFIGAMHVALPAAVREQFSNHQLYASIAFLSVLLRLWATTGELMLAGVAYALDYRGAMNRPDAPGRCEPAGDAAADDLEQGPSPLRGESAPLTEKASTLQ